MSPILVAIIGFIGTVSAPIITLAISRWFEQKRYPAHEEKRLKFLVGTWKGTFSQKDKNGNPIVAEANATLSNKGRIIFGTAQHIFDGRKTRLNLYNGMYDGVVLKIEYMNEFGHVIQKGSIVAEMSAHGEQVIGKFVGYSPTLGGVINGEINFDKKM